MPATVRTRAGKLEGFEKDGLAVFLGIPFARPPVGDLRWRAPEPVAPWQGTRPANQFSLAAPQDKSPIMAVGETGEDCLYLNVWTPGSDKKKRPVLFWIHGGGFLTGSASQDIYEASRLAKSQDAVVVATNYRVGALGFGYLRELCGGGFDSNVGLLDQIAALRWTGENIAEFGGDPENVTIFGESAGGMSVGTLLGTPRAKGLFHKAVPQSGAAHHACPKEDGTRVAESLVAALGLPKADSKKLRELSAQEIVLAQRKCLGVKVNERRPRRLPLLGMAFIPVIEGDVLPQDPLEAIRGGLSKDVPVMAGTNLDEWNLFIVLSDTKKQKMDEAGLEKSCEARAPGKGRDAIALYRRLRQGKLPAAPPDLFGAIESDRVFRVPAIRLVEAQIQHQKNTYLYLFTWPSPAFAGKLRSCHALELPFVFGTLNTPFGRALVGETQATRTLSAQMQDLWGSFARTGRPEGPGLPAWSAYDTAARPTLVLDERIELKSDPFSEERRFWDDVL